MKESLPLLPLYVVASISLLLFCNSVTYGQGPQLPGATTDINSVPKSESEPTSSNAPAKVDSSKNSTGDDTDNRNSKSTRVDKNIELNVPSKDFYRDNYNAGVDVEFPSSKQRNQDQQSNLNIGAGASISAKQIHVNLKNVQGHVTFRGSLRKALDVLRMRGKHVEYRVVQPEN